MDAIEMRLRKIGKKAFVDYLYVELKKNIDVSIEEITHKHIEFGRYKLSSQKLDYPMHVLYSEKVGRKLHFELLQEVQKLTEIPEKKLCNY